LFSDEQVAAMIQQTFEPVWETVRAVPIVRIDFGDGKVLTRTLNGNIATSVCTADGQVLDILPGIYTKAGYLTQLGQFRLLARYVDQEGKPKREARLKQYHQAQAAALKRNEAPLSLVANPAPITKRAIENPLKVVLQAGTGRVAPVPQARAKPPLESPGDVASWQTLAEDTRLNETLRRRQIHELLAATGLVRPEAVTRRLYREVLHADLDDPYLGLGPTLFASYPFKD
jgi:hypothetical protein